MNTAEPAKRPNYYLLLAAVAVGGVLAPINSTMLAVALPELRQDFGISHGEVGWLISAYLIAMAVAQPVGGRLSDQLGRARVYRAGLIGFLTFSLAAVFAPSFPTLVVFRTGQAIAGAVLIPNGMAMLRESVPVDRLGRIYGLNGAVMGTAAAAGPLIGGGLLALGSWRLLFLVNVPIVALAFLVLARVDYRDTPSRTRTPIDWIGAALFALALIALTYLLNSVRGGQGTLPIIVAAVVLTAFAAAFAARQLVAAAPVIEWQLFAQRAFAAATSYTLLVNLVMYTMLLTVPFFIQEVQGRSPAMTGLLLGVMSVLMAVIAPISGRVSDAYGRRWPALAGACLALAAAIFLLTGLDEDVPVYYLAIGLALLGAGVGMGFGAATTAAIESAPRSLAGSAAGTNSMMRYIGSILGAGILVGILNTSGATVPGIGVFQAILAIVAGMAALAIVAGALIHRFPPERDGAGLENAGGTT